MFQADRQRKFSNQRDYNDFALVRVHNRQLAALGGRGSWARLTLGGKSVFRTIKGAGNDGTFSPTGLEFDYDTAAELGMPSGAQAYENGFYGCAIEVRKATATEKWIAHWRHRIPLTASRYSSLSLVSRWA